MSIYPGAIPTLDEIFKVTDFVDWVKGEEWDDFRAELRAIAVELGTLPKGTFDNVKLRLNDIYPQYHDRGDPAAYDRTVGNFTTDGTWRTWDLSGIVPAGATAVLLRIRLSDDAVGTYIRFRKNGNSNATNRGEVITQVAGVTLMQEVIVACDAGRVIEYYGRNVAFVLLSVLVAGWWK